MSVYFAHAGDYTKIGYSAHPIRRAATLTTNGKRPDDLPRGTGTDLVGWVPGDRWREAEIQARFIDRRVAGEWFRRIDDDLLRDLIWADPRGVDLYRMTSSAVLSAMQNPEKTRDEIEAVGYPVVADAYWQLRA
jgi:hypothetical protein